MEILFQTRVTMHFGVSFLLNLLHRNIPQSSRGSTHDPPSKAMLQHAGLQFSRSVSAQNLTIRDSVQTIRAANYHNQYQRQTFVYSLSDYAQITCLLFCSWPSPQYLAQCLAHSRHSVVSGYLSGSRTEKIKEYIRNRHCFQISII